MDKHLAKWRVIVKRPDGLPLLSLLVEWTPVESVDAPRPPSQPPPASLPWARSAPGADDEHPMTEPQRRYLFRMLAARGLDVPQAEQYLKTRLAVTSLSGISRSAARQLIEDLLSQQQEAQDGRP